MALLGCNGQVEMWSKKVAKKMRNIKAQRIYNILINPIVKFQLEVMIAQYYYVWQDMLRVCVLNFDCYNMIMICVVLLLCFCCMMILFGLFMIALCCFLQTFVLLFDLLEAS